MPHHRDITHLDAFLNRSEKLPLVIFLLLVTLGATAQPDTVLANRREQSATRKANEIYNQLYLYNADIGFITPPHADAFAPKKYLLTSDVTPHFVVIGSSRFRGSLIFTPRTKVRILDERSQPVRTPSFMPALTYYRRMSDATKHYRYLTLNVTHHSNGQDGPERLPNGTFNIISGSFSTNFLELGYQWGTASASAFGGSATSAADARRNAITYYKVALARHISSDDVLTNRYGFTRLNGKLNWIKLGQHTIKPDAETPENVQSYVAEKHRVTVNVQWIFGTLYAYNFLNAGRRLSVELNYYYRLPFQYANCYLYAGAGYYGQDPYNIYFNDHYGFARVGAAYGISVYKGKPGQ